MKWSGVAFALVLGFPAPCFADSLTDKQVRQIMNIESIATYPGHCPCPYNTASNGSSCGKRSAWSKAGGYAPLCYVSDISDTAVRAWRAQHGEGE